jgi:hypothetical protein
MSRLTVPEAARQLGISPEAVRNRLSRGTLKSVKESGTVYVLLQTDRTRHTDGIPSDIPEALVVEMRGRIESLERQLEQANERDRENRRIIAALTSRIPAIEAPQEAQESPEPGADMPMGPTPREASAAAQEPAERVSWWRRMFGG